MKIDPTLWRRIWHVRSIARPVLRAHRGLLAGCVALALGLTALELLRPQPIRILFDTLLLPNVERLPQVIQNLGVAEWPASGLVAAVCSLVLVLGLATAAVNYLLETRLAYLGNKIVSRLRKVVFRHLLALPSLFYDTQKTGDLVVRLTGDIHMIRELAVNFVVSIAGRVTLILGMGAMMIWMSPKLAFFALILMPLLAWATWRATGLVRKYTKRQREQESEVAQTVHELIGEMRVFAAYGRIDMEDERFDKQNRSSFKTDLKSRRVRAKLSGAGEVTLALGICATLGLGTLQILDGNMSAGELLVFLSYQRTMFKPIRSLVNLLGRMGKALACSERVLEILETETELRDEPGAIEAPDFEGAIDLRDITLTYAGKADALTGLNLRIEPGDVVGIHGASGSGKSSLCMLIPRLYDADEGVVEIDGVDIRRYTLESLRSRISLVLQEDGLFDLSVAENVAFGLRDWKMRDVETACRAAGIHEDVAALRRGYETVIGERGAMLSGGQRRRLALARALIRNPRILILDEPFKGLDPKTAEGIRETILGMARGRTVLIVSHHDEHFKGCNRIVRIADGQAIEDGPTPGGSVVSISEVVDHG